MAVNDTVNGMAAANAVLTYQPAAGVEVCITSLAIDWAAITPALYDGANSGNCQANNNNCLNVSIMVKNTNYLRLPANAAQPNGYTGVQTK